VQPAVQPSPSGKGSAWIDAWRADDPRLAQPEPVSTTDRVGLTGASGSAGSDRETDGGTPPRWEFATCEAPNWCRRLIDLRDQVYAHTDKPTRSGRSADVTVTLPVELPGTVDFERREEWVPLPREVLPSPVAPALKVSSRGDFR